MYVFTIGVFIALAIEVFLLALDRFLSRFVDVPREVWLVAALGAGIGVAWALNFDFWSLWHVPVRGQWLGVTITGASLAGLAWIWRALLGILAGLGRLTHGEAAVLEAARPHRPLKRAA